MTNGKRAEVREKLQGDLAKFIEETLFYEDLPGLCLGVKWERAGLNFKGAAGYKDYDTKEALSPDHIFHMCSLTKLFVGTAVMRLWEEGALRLDSKMVEILPWLSIDDRRYEAVTVRHVLTHTAGLADVSDYEWNHPRLDPDALRDYVRSDEVTKSKLLWGPEEGRFCYSNMGYELLGRVIEEVSGESFEAYVEEQIFRPLGMTDSGLLTFERSKAVGVEGDARDPAYARASLSLENLSKAGLAMPHKKDEAKRIVKEAVYPYNRAHGPSSTLTTNLRDAEKWADAHLREPRVLRPETYDLIWREYATVPNNNERMGLSWFTREQGGYTLHGHEGTDDGFRSSFWICPELGLHIVTLSNLSKAPVKKITCAAFDLLLAGGAGH